MALNLLEKFIEGSRPRAFALQHDQNSTGCCTQILANGVELRRHERELLRRVRLIFRPGDYYMYAPFIECSVVVLLGAKVSDVQGNENVKAMSFAQFHHFVVGSAGATGDRNDVIEGLAR